MAVFEQITVDVRSEQAAMLRRAVDIDGYESVDQVVNEALREWAYWQANDKRKLAWLKRAIEEGEKSGPGIPADEAFAQVRAHIDEVARERREARPRQSEGK